jgi:hypothetical protein
MENRNQRYSFLRDILVLTSCNSAIVLSLLVKIASVTPGNLVCKPLENRVCERENLLSKLAEAELLV